MKIVGSILLGITCLLIIWKWGDLSLWSMGLGTAFGAGFFVVLLPLKPQAAPPVQTNEWQDRFHTLESQTTQTIDGLNREVQKLQQKLVRAEERCLSYQKLVDVHQGELDKLSQEKNALSESLIEKDRKLNAARMSHIEPDLFEQPTLCAGQKIQCEKN